MNRHPYWGVKLVTVTHVTCTVLRLAQPATSSLNSPSPPFPSCSSLTSCCFAEPIPCTTAAWPNGWTVVHAGAHARKSRPFRHNVSWRAGCRAERQCRFNVTHSFTLPLVPHFARCVSNSAGDTCSSLQHSSRPKSRLSLPPYCASMSWRMERNSEFPSLMRALPSINFRRRRETI